jgi:hypothetical protein
MRLLLLFALCICSLQWCNAAVYVATNGTLVATGSVSDPFLTIEVALAASNDIK